MAAKHPEYVYTCDICGEEGFSEVEMRSHTMVAHIEGAISCPFCDLGDISAEEMVFHVNSMHLDFLSPTEDNVQFTISSSDSMDDVSLSSNGLPDTNFYSASESSPQRANLSLNLNPNKYKKVLLSPRGSDHSLCPLCDYSNKCPTKLQEHVNRQHFDLTSPSIPEFSNNDSGSNSPFLCPLCDRNFDSSRDVELHVNVDHNDILSPIKSTQATPGDENCNDCCPVCGSSNFMCSLELASHIEEHFSPKSPNGLLCSPSAPYGLTPLSTDASLFKNGRSNSQVEKGKSTKKAGSADHLFALEIERKEREEQRVREQREFRMLQAQYGMDNQGNFREQSITNMQKAVYAGEMSVADYYNRQVELCIADRDGVDDGHSCTKGLIPKIRAFSMASSNVEHLWLCTAVDHYGATYGDKGCGCGYRNIQMMLSSLINSTKYSTRLFNGRFAMPSISKLQELIEGAWRQGFDPPGCEQLGGRLINTRKWIGATEVVTFLASFRIRGRLIDCHEPTGPNGTHPELFSWVKGYFMKEEEFKPPVYLQHHGHSRTIIGIEELQDGSLQLLVLDPSHSKSQMEQFNSTSSVSNAIRLIKRPISALKARQYQLVYVDGVLETEEEYQSMKILHSQRIPPSS
uniref:Zinc finger-containing ubiquitin peptidase 1 n=1 Tax=Parasteatoda tepidariorum TaxID=114398 RepID=A0A2L2YQB0_PARTP